jgi:hypothetical protein
MRGGMPTEKKKELFLKAYAVNGTIRAACRATDIQRSSYVYWTRHDLDFAKEFENAKLAFAEGLEDIALDRIRNPDKSRGSDVLLMALLNANMPSKYRPQVAMSEDSAKELIMEWRKASKEVSKKEEVVGEELPANIQDTLADILTKRKDAPPQEDDYGSITEKDIAWG